MELKQKILRGETVLGTMLSEVATANVARIMKVAGYEFMIVDCEHGYFDFSQLANIIAVGCGFQMPIIVRIPNIEREFITKVLDMGGAGILVPMVSTVEEARRAVQLSKYPPMGTRGISTTRAHTNYDPPVLVDYVKSTNEKTMVFVQIETQQGVENVEEIAAVAGVDGVIIGPNDLAVNLGWPGHMETPEMDAAITKVVKAAEKAGKASGIIESHVEFLKKWRANGMNVFSCSSEVGMMMKMAKATCAQFHEGGK